MRQEHRNENGSRKRRGKRGKQRPRWDRRVTRSVGDGVRAVPMERMVAVLRRERMVAHVSQNIEHHLRIVAQLRRERMVAHDLANTSFGISISAFRGSFF